MLETHLRSQRERREILLMTHLVLGYPSFDACLRMIEAMAEAGVELIELQIPFSEPIADGPVILHANQRALERGASVERCLDFAAAAASRFELPFVLMSYYNILFRRGVARFAEEMAERGLKGAIVPDLPPEEAAEYLTAMQQRQLDPIFIFSPNTSQARLRLLAEHARGFVYCVARKGVTGSATEFTGDLGAYIARCREATPLPLAVGFGVRQKSDVDFLRGKADIAVVGSQTLRIVDERGVAHVGEFLRQLRE